MLIPKIQKDLSIYVAQHVVHLFDERLYFEWGGEWSNSDFVRDGVGLVEGGVSLTNFARSAGYCPLIIEFYESEPEKGDVNEYHSVIEAPIKIDSGNLIIFNEDGEYGFVENIPKGNYSATIYYANETTCDYDYDNGANHARVVIYPKENTIFRVLKEIDEDEIVIQYKGKKTVLELKEMLNSELISYRYLAIVALSQLGEIDYLLSKLDDFEYQMFDILISSIWMAGEKSREFLENLVKKKIIYEKLLKDGKTKKLKELFKNESYEFLSKRVTQSLEFLDNFTQY